MSLLWIQAAWHTERPGDEDWDVYGHGHESLLERHNRWAKQVQDAHGVDRETALGAIRHVAQGLHSGATYMSPVESGFASQPQRPGMGIDMPEEADFKDAWDRAPIHQIDLSRPVHASQTFLRPRHVAHNLFHPGEVPPSDDEEVGHPDALSNDDPEDEDYLWHTNAWNGATNLPRVIRQTDGSHVVVDGHHRLAGELLLKKKSTAARVLDVRHLSGRLAPREST